MNQSEHINELAKALAEAQAKLDGVLKGKENPFFKSRYADLSMVWQAWKAVGPACGLSIAQVATVQDGEPVLATQLMHSSGQWIRGQYPIKPVKADPQSVGSAITYARRYALAAMVGIAPEDDDDDGNIASGKKEPSKTDKALDITTDDRREANEAFTEQALAAIAKADTLDKLKAYFTAKVVSTMKKMEQTDHDLWFTVSEAYKAKVQEFV